MYLYSLQIKGDSQKEIMFQPLPPSRLPLSYWRKQTEVCGCLFLVFIRCSTPCSSCHLFQCERMGLIDHILSAMGQWTEPYTHVMHIKSTVLLPQGNALGTSNFPAVWTSLLAVRNCISHMCYEHFFANRNLIGAFGLPDSVSSRGGLIRRN
jgi:hypothetical protein